MLTVHDGRPTETRTAVEEKTYEILDSLNIVFKRVDHSPADTIEKCHRIEEYIDASICKNLFLTNRKKDIYCLLLMPGDKKYEARKVSRQIGSSRLSFASDEDLMKYLQLTPGSVSVMGLINDTENKVILAMDSELLDNEYFCCHPCINTSTLKFRTADITEKFIPFTKHEIKIIDM